MKAVIANFRRGRHTQTCNQMIIKAEGISDKDKAKELIGKTVTWKSPAGKEIKGKITKEHGNSGAVKVLFEKGMPGQSIGSSVEVQ
tara:strand:- start:3046 stop:3303 length:258 start_codon:yes stop_codon:yes gene_type:complete